MKTTTSIREPRSRSAGRPGPQRVGAGLCCEGFCTIRCELGTSRAPKRSTPMPLLTYN